MNSTMYITNAGNVGDGINLQLLPDIRCDLYRLTRPGTARAVGTALKFMLRYFEYKSKKNKSQKGRRYCTISIK